MFKFKMGDKVRIINGGKESLSSRNPGDTFIICEIGSDGNSYYPTKGCGAYESNLEHISWKARFK